MKKFMFFVVLVCLCTPAFNQKRDSVLVTKHGMRILPEKGDIAIGIDAVPFLQLLKTNSSEPGFNFVNNVPAISLKYFNSDNSALRMKILIGYSSMKEGDEGLDNFINYKSSSIGLNFGYEKRLGKSRVQGFIGAEGGIAYGKLKNIDDNEVVTLEGTTFAMGASFILGAEFFIAPKLSIGGEFTWGPRYMVAKNIDENMQMSDFTIGAGNANGALILAFHF
jgi:hypothetical protein